MRPRARAAETYWPFLDGIRALAVGGVIAYHLGHLPGGWIGVDVFFVLSGYLITTLLVRQRDETGSVLGLRFWGRRARRLLPAVFLLLAALGVYAWAGGPGVVPAQLRSPALGTFFYVANWQQLASGSNYFAQFTAPSPLTHTWSLAIEEQYYLVWPFLLAGLLLLVQRGGRPLDASRRRMLAGLMLAGATASAVWMGVAALIVSANRAYLGTDTRAWELLLGGAAAILWPAAGRPVAADSPEAEEGPAVPWSASGAPVRPARQRWVRPGPGGAALLGIAGLGAVVAYAGGPPGWIWEGGLVAAGVCSTAVIVGTLRAPGSELSRVLSSGPFPWIGRLSYSLYLWHWPVIVILNQDTLGLSGWPLLVVRLAVMTAASSASYYLVERPLRRADWSAWRRLALAPLGAGLTAALVLVGTVTPVSAGTAAGSVGAAGPPVAAGNVPRALPVGRVPSPADPLRVWLFGDSVMYDSSAGLDAALQATGDAVDSANSSFGGWGLSTDHVWPSDARRIISQYRPEVAIGTWSWDDQLAATDLNAYESRLHDALAAILSPGNGVDLVILLAYPPQGPDPVVTDPAQRQARWAEQVRIQAAWNRAAATVTAQFPGHAAYLSLDEVFAPGGRFFTWMRTADRGWVRARKLDNTHMCPLGAALFGAAVVDAVSPALSLSPLRPGWESGSWVNDGRYNDPPGACPDDQPPDGYNGVAIPGVPAQLAHTEPDAGGATLTK